MHHDKLALGYYAFDPVSGGLSIRALGWFTVSSKRSSNWSNHDEMRAFTRTSLLGSALTDGSHASRTPLKAWYLLR